jgi:hypothetical protein
MPGIIGERSPDLTAVVFVRSKFHLQGLVFVVVHSYPRIVTGDKKLDISTLAAWWPGDRLYTGNLTSFGVLSSCRFDMDLRL